jgi:hypothetical protein
MTRFKRKPMKRTRLAPLVIFALAATAAQAREIHLDCARTGQTVMIDVDTDRRFLQLMWGQGVAEEYQNGESYVSGPDAFGETQKVTYVLSVDKDLITFGQDRACIQSGTKHKCVDQETRNTLDLSRGELKYDDGDEIAILQCTPAPPGRGF